ncbi:MAG: hypothetical protein Q8Q31_01105 [Nanoarchaeota archaeon]|nr:hypothetical protein [Nanoarchaeota archaeon]
MQIVNNRYLETLFRLMLLSAIVHVTLLIIYSMKIKDLSPLNYISILEIDLFFPSIVQNASGAWAGWILLIVLYVAIFHLIPPAKTPKSRKNLKIARK